MILIKLGKKRNSLVLHFGYIEEASRYWSKNKLLVKIRCSYNTPYPDYPYVEIPIYVTTKKIIEVTGLQVWELSLIRGAYINFTYYKKGEECQELGKVQKEKTIIKDIIIRVDKTIENSFQISEKLPFKPEPKNSSSCNQSKYNMEDFVNDALGGQEDAIDNLD